MSLFNDKPEGMIAVKKAVLDARVAGYCQLPYQNHPKGCPNYGREGCPPNATSFFDYFDKSRILYIVHSEFNLKEHAERMKEKHPKWSDRQCRCCLYWQGTSRKQLRERVKVATEYTGADAVAYCPEAMGLNVYETASESGLILDPMSNIETCRHVAIIGYGK